MHRRSFLFGVGASLIAAPAIVRAASLMPVKPVNFLRFGHRAADPIVLYGDEGIISLFDLDAMRGEVFKIMGVPQHWLKATELPRFP